MGLAKKKKRPTATANKDSHAPQQPPITSNTSYYLLAFLLIIATALLYGQSLRYPLVFDDLPFFSDANLRQYGSSFFQLDLRWFSYASFGWTYKLFGHEWFWYRIGNLALHVLNCVLLFAFFSRLLEETAQPQDATTQPRWSAFFAALIFALHPVAVYGVAYLVERSIVMATLFGIAALLCYMEGLTRDRAKWFLMSALFYFLAVFSKEHSIMIPGVAGALTLLLYKPSYALLKKVWLPFSLYLVIGILIIMRTKGLLGAAYEMHAADMLAKTSEQQEDTHIANAYLLSVISQGYLFFKYLLLWIFPYTGWMAIDIRQPFATHFLSWPELPGFLLFLTYPVLAIKLLVKGGRRGLLGFGLLFPWTLYLTELASIRIQEPFVLYRSYLWMSGLPIVLFSFMSVTHRKFIPILLAAYCLVLASLAWNRLNTLSDNIQTWSDAIDKYQGDNLLRTERGYTNRGNAYSAMGRLPEALADYQKSIELNPKYAEGYNNSAFIYSSQNNPEEALRRFNTAIGLKPDYGDAYGNRAAILTKMGRYAESLSDFERAIQLSPGKPFYYSNRGIALSNLGRLQEALNDFDKSLSLDPKDDQVLLNRGLTLNALNRKNGAMESFRKSCDAGNPEGCKQLQLNFRK